MHEFTSIREAIDKINRMEPRPEKVTIKLGKVRGSARGFEKMFREHTRGTSLEGISLEIEQVPAEIKCKCGLEGPVRIMDHVHFVRCPKCGEVADLIKGNELDIKGIECL
jgi:Zn finger protein HypA/HybF involved in hydrogenase expression